jgi:hypothetical protein
MRLEDFSLQVFALLSFRAIEQVVGEQQRLTMQGRWSQGVAVENRCSIMERDSGSRRVLYVALAVAILWGVWCLLYETTGFPGLNYLAFGFVSLPVGAALFIAGLIRYTRARTQGRMTSDAVTAMLVSVGIAVVPLAALVEFADYS